MPPFSLEISVEETGKYAPQWDLDSDLNGEASLADFLAFTKQSLILIADEVLHEEQGKGFPKDPIVVVDGRTNKSPFDVNPLGSIEFFSKANMEAVILETYQALLGRSPVDTGQYIASNYVFLNGIQVATDLASLQAWLNTQPKFEDKDLVRFVNIAPYGRKLERLGITAQRRSIRQTKSRDKRGRSGTHILAPNGTYFLTARAIRRKYKRNSVIKFSFIPGSQLGLTSTFKTERGGARSSGLFKRKKPGRTYLYPTITISVQESGIV